MSAPKITTERFYIEHTNEHGIDCLMRHLNRYKWADSHLKDRSRVLDVGCGSGYGDFVLLNTALHVHGVDVSGEAIKYAKDRCRQRKTSNRLTYEVRNIDNLYKISRIKHDAVVCIEMIEHLELEQQHAFLSGMKKILKPDGVFLVTTPLHGEDNTTKYHKHEFSKEEFTDLLLKYFRIIAFDKPKNFGIPENFMLAECREVCA